MIRSLAQPRTETDVVSDYQLERLEWAVKRYGDLSVLRRLLLSDEELHQFWANDDLLARQPVAFLLWVAAGLKICDPCAHRDKIESLRGLASRCHGYNRETAQDISRSCLKRLRELVGSPASRFSGDSGAIMRYRLAAEYEEAYKAPEAPDKSEAA